MPEVTERDKLALEEMTRALREAVATGRYMVGIFSVRGQGLICWAKGQNYPAVNERGENLIAMSVETFQELIQRGIAMPVVVPVVNVPPGEVNPYSDLPPR